jgi:hypothetical protein
MNVDFSLGVLDGYFNDLSMAKDSNNVAKAAYAVLRKQLVEGQKPPTNNAMDAITLLERYRVAFPMSSSFDDFIHWLKTYNGLLHQ